MSDPIIAAIAHFRHLEDECTKLFLALDEAQCASRAEHGARPCELIVWRKYQAIGGSELEEARDHFLAQPGADAQTIEAEYQSAQDRLAAQHEAGKAWDRNAGLAELRQDYDAINEAERSALMALVTTEPATAAGAAALLAFVKEEMEVGDMDWHPTALATIIKSLNDIDERSRIAA